MSKASILFLFVLPIFVMLGQLAFELSFEADFKAEMMGEAGIHEAVQALIMAASFLLASFIFVRMDNGGPVWLRVWISVAALCSLYVAGEEVSWGQHIWNWSTPEYWQSINDQGETNFHNTSSWLDQKPRLVLLIGVICGGLIFPLLQKYKPGLLPEKFAIIYPPASMWLIALMALFIQVADDIGDEFPDLKLFHRASEVEELYLFYFVLVYLCFLYTRLRKQA